jgi:hypothetical protein
MKYDLDQNVSSHNIVFTSGKFLRISLEVIVLIVLMYFGISSEGFAENNK